ncbi:MAG: DM13 domain-containing protein [Burkholderiaceae bacterium]
MKYVLLVCSHGVVLALGFALGVYWLPILTAPPAPTASEVGAVVSSQRFEGSFRRDLKDSDALHWGEGKVLIGAAGIALQGSISPGPDYKLYLSPEFVETEADFKRLKASMVRVGDVKTFQNFTVPLPASVDPAQYKAVIIWCETFSEFITAAQYQ